jgi:hypothetical protein
MGKKMGRGKDGRRSKEWDEDALDTSSMSLDEVKDLLSDRRKITVKLESAGFWNIDFPLPMLSILTGILQSGSLGSALARSNLAMYSQPASTVGRQYWGRANAKIEEGGRFRILVAVAHIFELWVVIDGKEVKIVPEVKSSPNLGGEVTLGTLKIPAAAAAA